MAVGWFFAPYKRRDVAGQPGRYCAMDDFTTQIEGDGGAWVEAECLGDMAVVKVRASAATLSAIAGAPGIRRVPVAHLNDTLDTLTQAQRQQLRAFLGSLGYTAAEIQARFGAGTDLTGVTLRDVLKFALKRRLLARYDHASDSIIVDGPEQPTTPLADIDRQVS